MYRRFAVMLGESFRESIKDFKEKGEKLSDRDRSFQEGYLMGLHRAFTLIEQSAQINEIDLNDIGLGGFSEGDFVGFR